jgi:hypothetical protein
MSELTFESLAKDIQETKSMIKTYVAQHEEEDKDKEGKKAAMKKAEEEKQEEEKKEAKKTAALKKAMDEDDPDKRDAAIRKAMDEDEEDKKEGKKASDEDKEKDAQIASIINSKKNEFITKILQANTIVNPTKLKEIDARLQKASIAEVEKEWNTLAPFVASAPTQQPTQQKFVPFYANIDQVDESQLNANSPDSDFSKLSTKDLLEMYQ